MKRVIDSTEKNKAPRLENIPIEFYQACWPIIKDNLMAVFTDFYMHKVDLLRINFIFITLISKTKEADMI